MEDVFIAIEDVSDLVARLFSIIHTWINIFTKYYKAK